ncbi:MAG: zinc-ribbon domain-containing protein, partial [Persicimonas sp.]
MDVQCPQCDTLYEIDARQLRGGAATFKCSHCQHVFRLKTHASLTREDERRWMVRDADSGDVLYFDTFDELHAWIIEGRVGARDSVSRTGDKWSRLGDIGEFRPIFQAAQSTSEVSSSRAAQRRSTRPGLGEVSRPEPSHTPTRRQRSATPASDSTGDKESAPADDRPNVRLQTGAFGSAGGAREEPPDESWSFGESSTLGELEGVDAQHQPVASSDGGRGVLIATLVVLLLGGAATGLYFGQPGLLDEYVLSAFDDSSDEGGDDEDGRESSGATRVASSEAVADAVEAAGRAQREPFAEARKAAAEALLAGVESAANEAQKEGKKLEKEEEEKASPDELLASGERALEQGST